MFKRKIYSKMLNWKQESDGKIFRQNLVQIFDLYEGYQQGIGYFLHTCLYGSVFIIRSPFLHGIQDRAHGLAEVTQGIFHPGRYFRVDGPGDQPVLFHGAEGVGQNLLADALQTFLQLIESPGAHH